MTRALAPRLISSWIVLFVLVTVAQAAKVPPPETIGEWLERVQNAEAKYGEQWSVHIEELDSTNVVFQYQPQRRLVPASNRKLAVMGLALHLLGPDYRFETLLGLSNPHLPNQTHYHGDLILRAQGDPSLDPIFLKDPNNPMTVMRQWVHNLASLGIVYIHGNLVIDAGAFGADQNDYPVEVWGEGHRNRAYAPIPSAIAVNGNMLRATVKPGSASGRRGRVDVFPTEVGISLVNETSTRSSGSSGVGIAFDDTGSQVKLTGRLRVGRDQEVAVVPLPRPLEYIGANVKQMLEDEGIRLTGEVVIDTEPWAEGRPRPIEQVIGRHISPPLNTLLLQMMRRSDNFIAEQLWRGAAVRATGRGDRYSTRQIEQRWLRSMGLSWIEPGWDGSGLSRRNANSAHELTLLMKNLYFTPYRDLLIDSLPLSGQYGTLKNRYFSKGGGRVRAKTGTLSGVSALTGFILDDEGQPRYVFSIIGNAEGETYGRLTMRITDLLKLVIVQMDARSEPIAAGG